MIRHVRHDQLDRPQWDALINQAPNGLIYALTWYLDAASPGWEALIKEEAGRYVAVLPLPVRRRFGFAYLQQPLLTQQLGLFYAAEAPPTATDWQQIGALLRQKFRFITRYSFNTANTPGLASTPLGPADNAFKRTVGTTYHLSLRATYTDLLAGYTYNQRWYLKKARRTGVLAEPTTDIEQLISLFKENTSGKITGGVGDEAYQLLRKLYADASQAKLATMWQARLASGEIGAIILLFHFKNKIIYMFSAANGAGKKAGAASVLLDEVFRTYAGQDLCFDFEAPPAESVTHFYRSFGPEAAPFLTISLNRLPWPVRQLRAARMAVVQRLPPRPASDTSGG